MAERNQENEPSIERLILSALGITNGAIEFASIVYDLRKNDPSVESVSFSRLPIAGYAGTDFLVANVKRDKPFESVEEFRKYLESNGLPSDDSNVTIESKDPLRVGTLSRPYTSDAFYAVFS